MPPPATSRTMTGVADAPILICYDGSAAARRAIDAAADLLGERSAIVVDVEPLETVVEPHAQPGSTPAALESIDRAAAVARAEAGAALARAAGLRAQGRGEVESPAWLGVVDVADAVDAAVIVLGSRGLCEVRALLEGSFSRLITLHAGRPVLIVPPPR